MSFLRFHYNSRNPQPGNRNFNFAVKEWLLGNMLIRRQFAHTPQNALSAEFVNSSKVLLPRSITPFPHRSYKH